MKKWLFLSGLLLLAACGTPPPRTQQGTGTADESGLIVYAKSLLGTPYHYGGESPRTGFDCSGFVRHVYLHSQGLSLPHNARGISRRGQPVNTRQLRPGDLVFYNTQRQSYSHVGIYLGNSHFIHAPSSGKAVEIADMNIDYWQRHYNGARRINPKVR
jgi:cell wall-associated NlpC family hydrolase